MLTGAGISTASGIPDFRGPQGVWTRDPAAERLSTLDAYMGDPEVRRRAWQGRLASPTWTAEPNAAHRALVALERRGSLALLVTQNIDGLHQAAGSDPALVVEIHGTIREVVCMRCGDRGPAGPTLDRVPGEGGPGLPGAGALAGGRAVRRRPEVGDDQLRPAARGRRPGSGGGGGPHLRPAAGRGEQPRRPPRRRAGAAGRRRAAPPW